MKHWYEIDAEMDDGVRTFGWIVGKLVVWSAVLFMLYITAWCLAA